MPARAAAAEGLATLAELPNIALHAIVQGITRLLAWAAILTAAELLNFPDKANGGVAVQALVYPTRTVRSFSTGLARVGGLICVEPGSAVLALSSISDVDVSFGVVAS